MISSTLQQCISLITIPLFTRLLSSEQYGLYSSYLAWETILTVIISFRLDYTVFNKGMSKFKTERNAYVASMQTSTTALALIVLAIYLIFRGFINSFTEMTTPLMLLMILQAAVYPAYSFWMLRERYEYKIRTLLMVVLSLSILNPLVGLAAIYLSDFDRGLSRIATYAGTYIIFGLILYGINLKKGGRDIDMKYIKFAFLFNIPMIPHYLSTYILNQSDRIMIQKMVGVKEVALYSVTYNAAMLMQIVSNSLINAITPWYYERLEEKSIERVKKLFLPIMSGVTVSVFVFILFAPELMMLLAPKEYAEAVYVIPPVASSVIFLMMYSFFSIPEFYYDANKFSSVASSVAALLNIGLNYICIRLFGYIAAGYTTLFCYVTLSLGHYAYARYVLNKNGQSFFNALHITLLTLFVAVLAVGSSLLYSHPIIRYTLVLIAVIIAAINKKKIIHFLKTMRS